MMHRYTLFFISNIFISNTRLKLAKNQANAKQHHETDFLLFENYSHSLSTFSFKQAKKSVSALVNYTINHNESEDENE